MEDLIINSIEAVLTLIGTAAVVAKLTPTKKDDEFIEKLGEKVKGLKPLVKPIVAIYNTIRSLVDILALNFKKEKSNDNK